jgi:hypothetical protein
MDQLRLLTSWDRQGLPAEAVLPVCLGGLQIQGAEFDGVRVSPVQQVRRGCEGAGGRGEAAGTIYKVRWC